MKRLLLLPRIVFILLIIPSIFLACHFTLGIHEELVERFKQYPFEVMGSRILASIILLLPIVLFCSILDIIVNRIVKERKTPRIYFKRASIMLLIGLIYALILLLLEYIQKGYLV